MAPHPRTAHLDRCADERARTGLIEALLNEDDTRVVHWTRDGVLVQGPPDRPWLAALRPADLALGPARGVDSDEPASAAQGQRVPQWTNPARTDAGEPGTADRLLLFLGRDAAGAAWVALAELSPDEDGAAMTTEAARRRAGLRDVGHLLSDLDLDAFMTTQALASWHATHRCCPRCGSPTQPVLGGWIRRCTADGSEHYPRTDPAVIMAIIDPLDRLLLARAPAWPENRRSVLAGFVEPGEHLESAVAREVAEEVGLRVRDIRYVGSQPWPFPVSLMLGFTARTDDAELRIDADEIVSAEWYTRNQLADAVASGALGLPGRLSIARRLIEGWFGDELVPPVEVSFHRPDAPATGPGPRTAPEPEREPGAPAESTDGDARPDPGEGA